MATGVGLAQISVAQLNSPSYCQFCV